METEDAATRRVARTRRGDMNGVGARQVRHGDSRRRGQATRCGAEAPACRALVMGAVAMGCGLPFVGAGPMNGDQAVYLDQAARFALTERWTHVGYVLIHLGWSDPLGSDVLTAVAGASAVALIASRWGILAGVVALGAVLPWLPFGEVDLPWWCATVLAVLSPAGWGAVLLGLAAAISPTALAALPWVAVRFDARWLGGLAAVGLLTVLSGGAWWVGNRGVLASSWSLDPVGTALPGILAALTLGRRPRWAALLALAPILAAPSDLPAGLIGVLAVCAGRERIAVPQSLRVVAWAVSWGWGANGLLATHHRVREETRIIQELASTLDPRDELVGPWSWRVRVSLAATGRVDGFAPPGSGRRVVRLPP